MSYTREDVERELGQSLPPTRYRSVPTVGRVVEVPGGAVGPNHLVPATGRWIIGRVRVDFDCRVAMSGSRVVQLRKMHWKLLSVLVGASGRVVRRVDVNLVVYHTSCATRSLDTDVAAIRSRLGRGLIVTHHGEGYSISSTKRR